MNTPQANDSAPDSNQRILLWDIDGTLLRSARAGEFRDYFAPMIESIFGTSGRLAELQVSGMTDLQIIAEALRDENFTHEHIRSKLDDICTRYMFGMKRAVGEGKQMFHVLPGVREALAAIAANPRYASSLLTGNIEPAAHLKLKIAGLNEFFKLPGAFGDDGHERRALPAIARARLSKHFNFNFQPAQFIVIGDTPNDIACARHFGARVVAVATGRAQTVELLRAHEPDALLEDLTDTNKFLRLLDEM